MSDDYAADEVNRLTDILHGLQKHPDYEYSVTFEDNESHSSRDGWNLNAAIGGKGRVESGSSQRSATLYWFRRVAK